MAEIGTTYSWAADAADLRAYLGVVGSSEDVRLEAWYRVAIEFAGDMVDNPFTDDDGADVEHPRRIRIALFDAVRAMRNQDGEPPWGVARATLRAMLGDYDTNPWLTGAPGRKLGAKVEGL